MSVEIKVLFNRRSAASWLCLEEMHLAEFFAILEREELSEAWSADENIGVGVSRLQLGRVREGVS